MSFPVMLAVLAVGCSAASDDPWAETELSRAVAEWNVRALAYHPDPDVDLIDLVKRHLGIFSPKPNLYDLHAPQGGLAIVGDIDGRAVLRILEAAGLPAEIDTRTAVTTYGGEPRQLWLTHDRTRVELPVTRMRVSLPPKPGVISITSSGVARVSDGQDLPVPIRPVDISTFAAQFASRRGAGRSERTRSPGAPPQEALVVGISEGSITVDGRTIALEGLLDEVTGFRRETAIEHRLGTLHGFRNGPRPYASAGTLASQGEELGPAKRSPRSPGPLDTSGASRVHSAVVVEVIATVTPRRVRRYDTYREKRL